MAMNYVATRNITLNGVYYSAGQTVPTTGWNPNVISEYLRLGWLTAQTAAPTDTGQELAYAEITGDYTIPNKTGTVSDVTGLQITVPAGLPFMIKAVGGIYIAQGTMAAGSVPSMTLQITDSANTVITGMQYAGTFGSASGGVYANQFYIERRVAALASPTTYKVRATGVNNAAVGNQYIWTAFGSQAVFIQAVAR